MCKNSLIIAAAGSGKTTHLVREALRVHNGKVLITTYTRANEEEIRKKILTETNGLHPQKIEVKTWFTFLLQDGVRPYQTVMSEALNNRRVGFFLSEKRSALRYMNRNNKPVYWRENEIEKHYFTSDLRIYSDKISKFVFKANALTQGEIISRLSRIYSNIFIDEVQDLAGWDLEIIKLLFGSSSRVALVGDPRQVTYLTHHPAKHVKYKNGNIESFISDKCGDLSCIIDRSTLMKSHRNNAEICEFSSRLFPEYPVSEPCDCEECRSKSTDHEGVYLVDQEDISEYRDKYAPAILRYKSAVYPEMNFGRSKGLSFDRVLIFPTKNIVRYLQSGDETTIDRIRAKFYVAITRARYSAAIVVNSDEIRPIDGLQKYISDA